ncbi:MAG: haloacid dehalogenase type II [Alphaproteobacteria bacterium]|nr:haloacid dehalogenase type II [Alphaproteobacteria bacterium]
MAKARPKVKALTCDVFGTVVDWRGSIIAEGEALSARKGIVVDWAAFADAWRAGYQPAMARVRRGELPWTKLDALHRMILDRLLVEFDISGLDAADVEDLNRAWHRLRPWPDAVAGLTRLRRRYALATLSNGNVSLLLDMAKATGLPWDCILSAEHVRHYKPDREVYLMAVELLSVEPGEIMMVAAHNGDLVAAASLGLQTAFIARPREHGPKQSTDLEAEHEYDVIARDFGHLADLLGA